MCPRLMQSRMRSARSTGHGQRWLLWSSSRVRVERVVKINSQVPATSPGKGVGRVVAMTAASLIGPPPRVLLHHHHLRTFPRFPLGRKTLNRVCWMDVHSLEPFPLFQRTFISVTRKNSSVLYGFFAGRWCGRKRNDRAASCHVMRHVPQGPIIGANPYRCSPRVR